MVEMEIRGDRTRRGVQSTVAKVLVLALVLPCLAIGIPQRQSVEATGLQVTSPWDRIVQGSASDDWSSLEAEAREVIAAIHGVPNDQRLVYWARDEIRSYMLARLNGVIDSVSRSKPLTAEELLWYSRMQTLVREKRQADAASAKREYDRWNGDKCGYDPPSGFGFVEYLPDGHPWCEGIPTITLPPAPPTAQQFTAYGAALEAQKSLPSADAQAAFNDLVAPALLFGVSGSGFLLAAAAARAVLLTPQLATAITRTLFPFALRNFVGLAAQNQAAGIIAGGATAAVIGTIAVAAAVTAVGLWLQIEEAEVPVKLDRAIQEAGRTPDLSQTFTTEAGQAELVAVLLSQTLPDFESERRALTGAPLTRTDADPFFTEEGSPRSSITTFDWEKNPQETYMVDGWFVTSGVGDGGRPPTYSLNLRFMGPNGERRNVGIRPGGFWLTPAGADPSVWPSPTMTDTLEFDDPKRPGITTTVVWAGNRAPTIDLATVNGVVLESSASFVEGSEVTFSADVVDVDGDPVTVVWETQGPPLTLARSDGTTHTVRFGRDGLYQGRIRATDSKGATSVRVFSFTIENAAPSLTVNPPAGILEGQTATINGSFSDVGDDPILLTIDWGDGRTTTQQYPMGALVACSDVTTWQSAADPTSFSLSHTYATPPASGSTYPVRVTVDDCTTTTTTTVAQPVSGFTMRLEQLSVQGADEGSTAVLRGFVRNDSPGFRLLVNWGVGLPQIFEWPCPAGQSCPFTENNPLDPLQVCFAPFCSGRWFQLSTVYPDDPPGSSDTYPVFVTLLRDLTVRATTEVSATVRNVPPIITAASASDELVLGQAATVDVSFTDRGADTHQLTVDWGDGATSTVPGVVSPTAPITRKYGAPGLYTVSIEVVDDDGGSSGTVQRQVRVLPVPNGPPTARDEQVDTGEDDPVVIDLAQLVTDDLTPSDQLSFEILEAPASGTLDGIGPLRTYTPDPDTAGIDRFTFRVADRGSPDGCDSPGDFCLAPAWSEPATVTVMVTPENDAPTATLSGPTAVDEGATVEYSFTVNDADGLDDITNVDVGCGLGGEPVGLLQLVDGVGSFRCHFPDGPALSTVTVDVIDVSGAAGAATPLAVTVSNVAPTLVVAGPTRPLVIGETAFITGYVDDPGRDQPTVTIRWGDRTSTSTALTFVQSNTYSLAGTYEVDVVVDDGDDTASSVVTIVVLDGGPGVEAVAQRLAGENTAMLTRTQQRLLAQAIDLLRGPNGGAGIGASDLVATGPAQALSMMYDAVDRLRRIPQPFASDAVVLLTRLARGIAVDRIAAIRVEVGCVRSTDATCSGTERRALDNADAAIRSGDVAVAQGAALSAISWYRTAVLRAERART